MTAGTARSRRTRQTMGWCFAVRRDIAKPLGIAVHDHIIVGKDGHASLKGLKLI